jgi:hypothetical protein
MTTPAPQNDMVWTFDYDTKALTRIATSPYGSEYTSNDYYELGDYAYMTAVVQVRSRLCLHRGLLSVACSACTPEGPLQGRR